MRVLFFLALSALTCIPGGTGTLPSIAFFFGAQPPWNEMRAFDWVDSAVRAIMAAAAF